MDEKLVNKIYHYIDKNGIPIQLLVVMMSVKVNIEENPYEETYLEKGVKIRKSSGGRRIKFLIPFELSDNEKEEIILKYLKDTTGYIFENPHSLIDFPTINGLPFLLLLNEHEDCCKLSLGKKTIPGSLITRTKYHNYGFKTLGNIEYIKGDFGIDSELNDLGNLMKVKGDLWFSNHVNHHLKSLNPLKHIGGNLSMRNTETSLGSLEKVDGNVSIRKSNVRDLGSLKYVGGNLLYSKVNERFYDFSNIEVKGFIRGYNDKF